MRRTKLWISASCAAGLLISMALVGTPAAAQQTPAPPAPAPPVSAPPAPLPPAAAMASDQTLAIPLPPNATVQMEMDIHDDDLLGVFKSFLKGIGQAANRMPPGVPRANTPQSRTDDQMAAILNNADLSDMLKDTTHVHFEVFGVPGDVSAMGMAPAKPVKGKAAPMPKPVMTPDQTPFYETTFGQEGGHRIIYVNYEPVHVLMTSFGHTRGYAFMMQMPGTIAVLRADGYPDLSKLSALATQVGAMAAKSVIKDYEPASDKKKHDDD